MAADINADIVKPPTPSRSAHKSTAGQDLIVEDCFHMNVLLSAIDAVYRRDRFAVDHLEPLILIQARRTGYAV